jgi:UDP-GlcNAc:undecaprenyl-phosphate GlcNAc-1-phosphate transferase
MLAVIGALGTFYTPGETATVASTLIPLVILAVPIFDVFAVILIRWRQGRPIYIGDKMHISHRFVKMGLSDNRAAWAVHLLHLATGIGGLALLWLPLPGTLIVLIQILAVLCMVSLLHHTAIRENGNDA